MLTRAEQLENVIAERAAKGVTLMEEGKELTIRLLRKDLYSIAAEFKAKASLNLRTMQTMIVGENGSFYKFLFYDGDCKATYVEIDVFFRPQLEA